MLETWDPVLIGRNEEEGMSNVLGDENGRYIQLNVKKNGLAGIFFESKLQTLKQGTTILFKNGFGMYGCKYNFYFLTSFWSEKFVQKPNVKLRTVVQYVKFAYMHTFRENYFRKNLHILQIWTLKDNP